MHFSFMPGWTSCILLLLTTVTAFAAPVPQPGHDEIGLLVKREPKGPAGGHSVSHTSSTSASTAGRALAALPGALSFAEEVHNNMPALLVAGLEFGSKNSKLGRGHYRLGRYPLPRASVYYEIIRAKN
jgi:hypothetical protein